MKEYTTPVLSDNYLAVEGVYAASGTIPDIPTPPDPPIDNHGSWSLTAKQWTNHNSGHLSCFQVKLHNDSGKSMCNLNVYITFSKKILSWDNISCGGSATVSKIGDYSLAINHSQRYNQGETVEFHIQNMHFEHDITTYCSDGQPVTAYSEPIVGGYTYPIPDEGIIVSWDGGAFCS